MLQNYHHWNINVNMLQNDHHSNINVTMLQNYHHSNINVIMLQNYHHSNINVNMLQTTIILISMIILQKCLKWFEYLCEQTSTETKSTYHTIPQSRGTVPYPARPEVHCGRNRIRKFATVHTLVFRICLLRNAFTPPPLPPPFLPPLLGHWRGWRERNRWQTFQEVKKYIRYPVNDGSVGAERTKNKPPTKRLLQPRVSWTSDGGLE